MPRHRLCVLVAFAVLAAAPTAAADADDASARAGALKKRGDELIDARRFGEALAAYDEAYALKPNPSLLYNRGRALEFLARYAEALDAITEFSRTASPELRAKVPGLQDFLETLLKRVSTVTIRCNVDGARVLLGGRDIGVCPFAAPIRVNAGTQKLDAFAEGYFPFHRQVSLPGGGVARIDVALGARSTSGIVFVTSRVPAARVIVDDRPIGVVPAESVLAAGEHAVRVEADGHDAASTRVVLRAGERKEVTLDPTKRPSILARWWFWTAAGVVVAGAAASVVVLTTERSAPTGDFSPGQVKF